jgi:hypothetical protein
MSDVTADVQRDIVALWGGPGFHIVHYPLRHGTLFNIVAVFRRSASSERGDVAAYRVELGHAYRNAHPSMKALLSMLDLGRRQGVSDRDPIRHWHKGPTTIACGFFLISLWCSFRRSSSPSSRLSCSPGSGLRPQGQAVARTQTRVLDRDRPAKA